MRGKVDSKITPALCILCMQLQASYMPPQPSMYVSQADMPSYMPMPPQPPGMIPQLEQSTTLAQVRAAAAHSKKIVYRAYI